MRPYGIPASTKVTGMATPKKQSTSKSRVSKAPQVAAPATPPGAALISRLWDEMVKRGQTTHQLADSLGITYVYLMKLASGEKPIFQIGRETLVRAAEYMTIPVAQAYLLAGALSIEDFVLTPTLDERLAQVREAMVHDAMWCGLALSDDVWQQTPQEARLLICMLYEQAAKTTWLDLTLIPKATQAKAKRAS
jgi:transcriptional regulator with XRE-family HTH domain